MNDLTIAFINKVKQAPDSVKKYIVTEILIHKSLFKNNKLRNTFNDRAINWIISFIIFFWGREGFRKYFNKKLDNDKELTNIIYGKILFDISRGNILLFQDFIKSLHNSGWDFETVRGQTINVQV